MNVLSICDGISTAMVALLRTNLSVNKYYASEIDKYATMISEANYPNIIRLGDMNRWREWNIDRSSIDLLLGGTPCQGFSFAGNQSGTKAIINSKEVLIRDRKMYLWAKENNAQFLSDSHLFWEFVLILDHVRKCNPKVKFLLENTKMRAEFLSMINIALGVDSVLINSALVSAQNRERHYWANWHIEQPKNNLIYLQDIIDDNDIIIGAMRGRCIINGTRQDHRMLTAGQTKQRIELRKDGKSNTLTTVLKDNLVVRIANVNPSRRGQNGVVYDIQSPKSPTITTNKGEGPKVGILHKNQGSRQRGLFENIPLNLCCHTIKHEDVLALLNSGWKEANDGLDNTIYWRTLTPIECERLQTLPEGFTAHVSNTQRIKVLGNCWNVDTIVTILKNIKKQKVSQERLFA